MDSERLIVGMGEYVIRGEGHKLMCVGIGSCIATVIYDSEKKIYSMGHIMLPLHAEIPRITANPNKYADICIPNMVKDMVEEGANKTRLKAKIAGGAHMFPSLQESEKSINVKNANAVRQVLKESGIELLSEDVGGSYGRTIILDTSTEECKIILKAIGKEYTL
ncbi:MAG: chemotaxis protein CheD [Candidatus Woesearchaeota archaeon]